MSADDVERDQGAEGGEQGRPERCDRSAVGRCRAGGGARRPAPLAGLAIVALVAVVLAGCGSDSTTTAEGGPASSADVATTTEPLGPELSTEWRGVRTDGSGLVIAFLGLAPVTDASDPCQADYRAVVDETDQEVTVTVHGTHVDSCPTDMATGRSVTVALERPLGDRLLTNGATERREVAFDGELVPDATWLPEGWEQLVDRPADPVVGPVTMWQVGWGPPRSSGTVCGADVSPVTLTVGPAQELLAQPWVTSFTTVGTTTVRGAPAEQARYQAGPPERPINETMLRWADGDEASVLRSAPSCVGEEPADFTLLQRLADGLS